MLGLPDILHLCKGLLEAGLSYWRFGQEEPLIQCREIFKQYESITAGSNHQAPDCTYYIRLLGTEVLIAGQ